MKFKFILGVAFPFALCACGGGTEQDEDTIIGHFGPHPCDQECIDRVKGLNHEESNP